MKIFIGSDHKGVELEKFICETLKNEYEIEKCSLPHHELDDYPDFAYEVAQKVLNTKDSLGIVICGNGIGIGIAANKVKGILCGRVTTPEDAHHAKAHNGCNMISFGGISKELAIEIVKTFIETPYPTEERHLRRIEKMKEIERNA